VTEYISTIPEVSSDTLELLNTEEMIEVDRLTPVAIWLAYASADFCTIRNPSA